MYLPFTHVYIHIYMDGLKKRSFGFFSCFNRIRSDLREFYTLKN